MYEIEILIWIFKPNINPKSFLFFFILGTSIVLADTSVSNVINEPITVERLSNDADARTFSGQHVYEEITVTLDSEISVVDDSDRVYYLHPIN